MKKLSVLFIAFIFYSCGIKDVLSPNLSADVKGVYQVYLVGNGVQNINLPSATDSITIELKPIDKSSSSYLISLYSKGDTSTQEGIFELKKSGEQIDLHQDGDRVGFVKNNDLDIDYVDKNGLRSVLKAKK